MKSMFLHRVQELGPWNRIQTVSPHHTSCVCSYIKWEHDIDYFTELQKNDWDYDYEAPSTSDMCLRS